MSEKTAAGRTGPGPVRAGIVVTGTEVLTGTISDRNGPWVSQELANRGVEVAYVVTVGDRAEDLEQALLSMRSQGLDLIVTTGGLGPTADDLTTEVVARFSDRELRLDSEMEAKIASILAGFARRQGLDPAALDAANRKQALIPQGAIPLDPIGTAPGLVVPAGEQVVIVLPGPPRELQPMWDPALDTEPVRKVLAKATPLRLDRLRMFGLPESELAASLRAIEAEGVDFDMVEITTCLRGGELEIDLRWREGAEAEVEAIRSGLAARHDRSLYSPEGRTIDELLAERLAGRRLAVAESCSAGLLAARIANRPGASDYFAGGVVSYADQAKQDLLGVDERLLADHGAVSPEVAEAMSRGALVRFGADTAVSITGVAGPGDGSEAKPVGYVCFCALTADGKRLDRDPVIPGGRADIRERSALVAMHLLYRLLA